MNVGDRVRTKYHPEGCGRVLAVYPHDAIPGCAVELDDQPGKRMWYGEYALEPADLTNDAPRRCSSRTIDSDGGIRQCVHQQGHSCKCEPTPRGKTDGECRECGHEYGLHYGYCDQYTERCPDAPRRRTEPALPPNPLYWPDLESFFREAAAYLASRLDIVLPSAFTPTEAEACKAHGAAAYACMAADCDQVRELLAVEEAKVAMEVWRLENAEWLDWMTDSDATGDLARQGIEYREQFVARWEAWLAALTPPHPGATLGDWAAAQPEPPMKWSREYMQHLYDKLAADPRALEASGRTEGP